jgi:hypothetical protein
LRSLRERQTEFERQQYRLSLPQLIHRSGLDNEFLCTFKNLTACRLTNHRAHLYMEGVLIITLLN